MLNHPKKIITHPANLELLKKQFDDGGKYSTFNEWLYPIEIQAVEYMEKERWTGKYILPDGRKVPPEDVRVPDGLFFEWENSPLELKLLEEWGLIRKEMEPLFVVINDSYFKSLLEMPITLPRFVITTAF